MKAAVVTAFGAPLQVEEVSVPQPGPGQILVRMEASGLCHTDIHAARGDWPVKPTPPFIPGHEGIGVFEAMGPGVTGRHVGQRVAIAWLCSACGHCRYCNTGWETLCESQTNSRYSINGAWAEYALATADFAVPVPAEVSSFDAAPLTCAGVTTYKAVKVAGVRPAERVAVFGIGGLGHLALQYARIAGGFVTAVDVESAQMVNARTEDPVRRIRAKKRPSEGTPETDAERALVETAVDVVLRAGRSPQLIPRATIDGPPPIRFGPAPSVASLVESSSATGSFRRLQSFLTDVTADRMSQFILPMSAALAAMADSQARVTSDVWGKVAASYGMQASTVSQLITSSIDRGVLAQIHPLSPLMEQLAQMSRIQVTPQLAEWVRVLSEVAAGDVEESASDEDREAVDVDGGAVYETIRMAAPDVAAEIDAEAGKAPAGQREPVRNALAVSVAALILIAYVAGVLLTGQAGAILAAVLSASGLNIPMAYKLVRGRPPEADD